MASRDQLPSPKRLPECVSGWQLSLLAADAPPSPQTLRAQQHVQQCPDCAARLQDERSSVQAARLEPISAVFRAQAARMGRQGATVRPRWWWFGGSLALAAPLLALFLVRTPSPSLGVRTKGSLAIELALVRDGKLLADGLAAESLSSVKAGDQLRLRVLAPPPHAWVRLEGREAEGWARYHEGTLAEDGWLPVGISITPDDETHLRVTSCPRAGAPSADCVVREWMWKTEP